MIEAGDVLRTWALAEEPAIDREIAATPLPDHRLAYLDYEGPVSRGRGTVTQWDRGDCAIEEATAKRTIIIARGQKLTGRVEIATRQFAPREVVFVWRPETCSQ
jgi:hypothetical protein